MRDKADPDRYFEWRKGIQEFPDWDGVKHDSDPGSLPPNALALGLNVRFVPGGVAVRPGISEVVSFPNIYTTEHADAVTSPVEQVNWLGVHHMQFRGPRLWMFGQGLINLADNCDGGWIAWYTPDRNPNYQLAGVFPCNDVREPGAGAWDGTMYFGDLAVLQRVNIVEGQRGRTIAMGTPNNYAEQVVGHPGLGGTALQEFDGKLFISLEDPAGADSKVGYWDGTTFVLEELSTGSDLGTNFCVWRDSKLVMLQYDSDVVRIRDLAGTWTSVNLPAVVTNYFKNSMVEFRDDIYIAAGQHIIKISNFDSPTASTVQTLSEGSSATAVTVLGDNLYYLWSGIFTTAGLGLYEPTQGWYDDYTSIGGDPLVCMTTYRNRIYAAGVGTMVYTHARAMDPASPWAVLFTFSRPVSPLGLRVL